MLKKLLFDFSDDFKNTYKNVLKKSIVFLIMALLLAPFTGRSSIVGAICLICLIAFGFIWGKNMVDSLVAFGSILGGISNNAAIRITVTILFYIIGIVIGYIYFLWSTIKFIICLVKRK
ncbi:hypothetical protein [uncultured Eubacterium sp.]|uniref:hypothetical protein n=1 Tax=uncultured Eubacterium sp. TaxID=165185 RepID=UPI0025D1EBB8|nr:hypothetical protein [uncultured Eubacterium sp.]